MATRWRILLAAACAAVTVTGCSTATEDRKAEESTSAVSSMTVAPETETKAADAPAPAVSEEQRKQAQAIAEEAEKVMLDPEVAPRVKYPKALGMFRDALAIDPNNTLSKDSIKLIEDIYKGMGRPVPEPT